MTKKAMRKLGLAVGAATIMTNTVSPVLAQEVETTVGTWQQDEYAEYTQIANISGEFTYDQDVATPADHVFNLFGTAATAMCAKPGFAFAEPVIQNYYINVEGELLKAATFSLEQLRDAGEEIHTLKCSCMMSSAIANAQVVGVPLANVLKMVDLDADVNTVTVKDAEGYGLPIPLSYAIENGAMLVYKINGEELPASQGAPVQLWMPGAAARYFTRGVMKIELSNEEELPEMEKAQDAFRAKINVLNHAGDTFKVGDQIIFEGYADDFDVAIAAVEFSMDNGKTWTSCSTEGATTDRWVYWYFGYTADTVGTIKMDVRARTADGTVSPLASSVVFTVE